MSTTQDNDNSSNNQNTLEKDTDSEEEKVDATHDLDFRTLLDPKRHHIEILNDNNKDAIIIQKIQQDPTVASTEYTFTRNRLLYNQRCLPLHGAILLGWSLEVIRVLHNAYPQAIKKKCCIYNVKSTPLHLACALQASGPESPVELSSLPPSYLPGLVLFLVETYPAALGEADSNGLFPIHTACLNRSPSDVISILLDKGPKNVVQYKTQFTGSTPLHIACAESLPLVSVKMLLEKWPDAAKEKTNRRQTPLHHAVCGGMNAEGMERIKILLEKYPYAVFEKDWERRTPLQSRYISREASNLLERISILLYHHHQHLEEANNDGGNTTDEEEEATEHRSMFAQETLQIFVDMKWYGGIAIVLNLYPTIKDVLTMIDDSTNGVIAPTLISFVARRCKLLTMQKLLCNRHDLLLIE